MLFEAYRSLTRNLPSRWEGLFGKQLSPDSTLWLAVDADHYPSLLFAASSTDIRPDIALQFVNVSFSRECEIAADDGLTTHGYFTVIRFCESDYEIVRLFLRILEEAFCADLSSVNNRRISDKVLEIAELFRNVDFSIKDIVGLWGELFIISAARSKENAARKWCTHKNSKFDFVCDDFSLEVKTTLKPVREHRFSLEQIRPEADVVVNVASIQLVKTLDGRAVHELIDAILSEIQSADLRRAFVELCLLKGGRDIYRDDQRFKVLSRTVAVKYYSATSIPAPVVADGAPISKVSFDINLENVSSLHESATDLIIQTLSNGTSRGLIG